MEDRLLEPWKSFKEYDEKHLENSKTFFEELTQKSNVNVDENRETIKKHKDVLAKSEMVNKELTKYKMLRTFLILFTIVGLVVSLLMIFNPSETTLVVGIVLTVIFAILGIVLIILLIKKINPKIRELINNKNDLLKMASKLKDEAFRQLSSLNRLFDWSIPSKLFTKTVPEISMDNNFDVSKYMFLHEKYGFNENVDTSRSTVNLLSGSIYGNPFLLVRDKVCKMGLETYSGSLVIHWTTTTTRNGQRVTDHHSQTLVATIQRPKPFYSYDTYLVYGNEAAPNLSFTRKGGRGYKGEDDEKIEKITKRNEDDLERLERKATKKGESYTRLGNDEFETFFGGIDRDNEVEFRLLFTPFAQQNMLNLLKNDPYGDDFAFNKVKALNYIRSKHSQRDYRLDPYQFVGFDYDEMHTRFLNINKEFFKGLFFDFAPLVSVPLYLQHKAKEYIYETDYFANIPSYEHEVLANSYDDKLFKHPTSCTDAILKSTHVEKGSKHDIVDIRAYAYYREPRVEFVAKLGGDGKFHNVPVHWYEYIMIENERKLLAMDSKLSTQQFNERSKLDGVLNNSNVKYQRGYVSSILDEDNISEDVNNLIKIMEKGEN